MYDGSGRLVSLGRVESGDLTTVDYSYDVDDNLVREHHVGPGGGVRWVHRHGGRLEDTGSGGRVIESVLPMISLEDGTDLRVSLLEPDGHAMWTFDLAGTDDTEEVMGVYGLPALRFGPPVADVWPVEGFHGIERADAFEVAHFGARHMVLRDGMWRPH